MRTRLMMALIFFAVSLYADIVGIGYGATNKEAKKEALADLAQNIKSEVVSTFESTTKSNNGAVSKNLLVRTKISSSLPILGAEISYVSDKSDIKATAVLKPNNSLQLYMRKLVTLRNQMSSTQALYKKETNKSTKLSLLQKLLTLLDEFERYATVTQLLGVKEIEDPAVSRIEVQKRFDKLASDIDSLSLAAKIVASFFDEKNIFLYPPVLQNYTTVAQFGSVFEKELRGRIKAASSLETANYILTGEYIKTKDTILLNYRLIDLKDNSIVKSKTIKIAKVAYKNLQIEPANKNFDVLLNKGIATSGKFHVLLSSNKGSNNLLFKDGETIQLFVKLNKMGYIYIVGYTQTKGKKFSYLLELNEAPGIERFIKLINADDVSRWISLGEFTVSPPFGVESLQVIASTKKPNKLPYAEYNPESGYYIISKNIEKALYVTRGLKPKKSDTTQTSEDVLSFVTMEK